MYKHSPGRSDHVPFFSSRVLSTLVAALRSISRLKPLDLFACANAILFIFLCVFTYYARFIRYRGTANLSEFVVYATAILLLIALLWLFFRKYPFSIPLLVLVQIGILAHFAGAYFQWDGHRLYDCYLCGIRYDKYVHVVNAFNVTLLLRHLFKLRGRRLDAVEGLFILLTVLGLGAVVEIVEYLVCLTIPGNGVGGYDNNMQDLIGNLVGSTGCVTLLWIRRALSRRAA